jgi:uncharacterized protein YbjT (DUF2867 family)
MGRIYELTGPQSQDMDGIAREFSEALNREITYTDISPEKWEQGLKTYNSVHRTLRAKTVQSRSLFIDATAGCMV